MGFLEPRTPWTAFSLPFYSTVKKKKKTKLGPKTWERAAWAWRMTKGLFLCVLTYRWWVDHKTIIDKRGNLFVAARTKKKNSYFGCVRARAKLSFAS